MINLNINEAEIESLVVGTPVVLRGDSKKIRNARLYGWRPEEDEECHPAPGEPYSPIIVLAATVGMKDYVQERHKNHFKYVVIPDEEKHEFIATYQNEFGAVDTCKFLSRSDFFWSLYRTKLEWAFIKRDSPIRTLIPNAPCFISDSYATRDEHYDNAAGAGLCPIYDLTGKERIFKYIVCKKGEVERFANHSCEVMIASEFDDLIKYTKWIETIVAAENHKDG